MKHDTEAFQIRRLSISHWHHLIQLEDTVHSISRTTMRIKKVMPSDPTSTYEQTTKGVLFFLLH